jgi:hypothetical protein
MYIHKNIIDFKINPILYIIEKYIKFSEDTFFNIYERLNFFSGFAKIELFFNKNFIQNNSILYTVPITKSLYSNIVGCKIENRNINQETIIGLILYYIQIKGYYLYNDNLYIKIEKSLISYRIVGSIEEILYEKFEENIVNFFQENFDCHFKGFNFYNLIKQYKQKVKKLVETIKDLTTNKINPVFSLLEFTDGIYNYNTNKFLKKSDIKLNNTATTLKYYDKTYKNLKKPNI